MNKEYIYTDGQVVVRDELGNQILTTYTDNIDEILVKENLVEKIEIIINDLVKKRDKLSRKIQIEKRTILEPFLMMTLACIVANIFMFPFSDFLNIELANSWHTLQVAILSELCTVIPASLGFSILNYFQYRWNVKEEKGVHNQLERLTKDLEECKSELVDLKKCTTKDNEPKEFKVVEVNDKEQLENLNQHIDLYYDCGYNEQKYYKYYCNGTLSKKLSYKYYESGIEEVEKYLKNYEPKRKSLKLVRKK